MGDYKIIVFFTTARLTGFMARLFNEMGVKTLEIHSRKSQSQRSRTADQFRDGCNLILFSSDVSARGMDYPDVTCVLQVGLTDREQYIHRLGRTARAGKEGHGTLLLAPFETSSMTKTLSDIPLRTVSLETLRLDGFRSAVDRGLQKVMRDPEFKSLAQSTYAAWLGFYNSNLKNCGWDKPELVRQANLYSKCLGLLEVPFLEKKTVGKMSLRGVPGLMIK